MKARILVAALLIAVVAMVALPAVAFADTTVVSGVMNNNPTITVTAPSNLNFGTFVPGAGNVQDSAVAGSVVVTAGSNGVANWVVSVASAAAFGGKMWSWDGTSYVTPLTDKLIISPDWGTSTYYADTGYSLSGGIAASGTPLYLRGQQTIEATDTVSGTYYITIVFSGSVAF